MRAQGMAVRVATEVETTRRLAPSAHSSNRSLRVVALGGGTGLPVLLRGLRTAFFPSGGRRLPARARRRLTAVVTAADDGGSSGRLRRAYRVIPPGDIRNCLLALSDGDPTLAAIFNYRFHGHEAREIGGHSLGNLILTALSHMENDFLGAVERAHRILGVRGRVFPATLEDVRLCAEFTDGSWAEGESRIAAAHRLIRRVRLEPEDAPALPQVRQAILSADLIVIGPGSLYTSLIPVLLVRELAEAVARSSARVVLVMNLMTEPGETDGVDAHDHVLALRRHVPRLPIHDVLLNVAPVPAHLTERYAAEGAVPIVPDVGGLRALGCRVVGRDLLAAGPMIRHDPEKLARAVLDIAKEVHG